MSLPNSFAFGSNWQRYIEQSLNQERIKEAKKSLLDFLRLQSLEGKSFLDIGCGSGLFSLSAHELGATSIVSLDIDPVCVHCCEFLKEKAGDPKQWTIHPESILDPIPSSRIGTFDIVYSWGVLHHTGKLWNALENAMNCVKPRGLLYVAIYNKADSWGFHPDGRFGPSSFWKQEKRLYVRLPKFLQRIIDWAAMSTMITLYIFTLRNPLSMIRNHKRLRGMSWSIDITDWLGGYPYEYASVTEIFHFARSRGFALENLSCNNGLLNNEYLFRKC